MASNGKTSADRAGAELAPGRHAFDAINVGDWVLTGDVEVTANMIDVFADLTGDHFAIHMDDAAARDKGFSGRVAHGLLVLSLIDGLKNQTPAQFDAVASLGWNWRFSAPVFMGDQLRAVIKVLSKRETSRQDRGILELDFTVENQKGDVVQAGTNLLMVHR